MSMTTFHLFSLLMASLASFASSNIKPAVTSGLSAEWYAGGRYGIIVNTSFTNEGILSVVSGKDTLVGNA